MDGPVLRENHKRRSEVGSGLILTTRRHASDVGEGPNDPRAVQ
jgi:hypothetical protein